MNLSRLKRISIVSIPDEVFMDGTEVLEIMRARILTRQEKRNRGRGTPDIHLKSIFGAETFISRTDLIKTYIGIDGKKITIASWKSNKNYLVYVTKNRPVAVLHCPRKPKYLLELPNKKVLKPGYYFVCNKNETGKIDREHGVQIGPSIFKKMFVINDSTEEYLARTKNVSREVQDVAKQESFRVKQSNNTKAPVKSVLNNKEVLQNNEKVIKINDKSTLSVVAKVYNRNNQLVGYVISNGKVEKPFPKNKVIEMCRKHQIRNMSLVEKDGKEFLRGIGITHESLPTKYI